MPKWRRRKIQRRNRFLRSQIPKVQNGLQIFITNEDGSIQKMKWEMKPIVIPDGVKVYEEFEIDDLNLPLVPFVMKWTINSTFHVCRKCNDTRSEGGNFKPHTKEECDLNVANQVLTG